MAIFQRACSRQPLQRLSGEILVCVIDMMDQHRSEIKLKSWLVSAGRDSGPGAPLNVPLTPASNFIFGGGRQYSRGDGDADLGGA